MATGPSLLPRSRLLLSRPARRAPGWLALRGGPAGLARGAGGLPEAAAQRLHQVDHVLAARPFLRGDWLAGALLVDEIDESGFVLVLELVGLEAARVCTENLIGVEAVMESPKLAE